MGGISLEGTASWASNTVSIFLKPRSAQSDETSPFPAYSWHHLGVVIKRLATPSLRHLRNGYAKNAGDLKGRDFE